MNTVMINGIIVTMNPNMDVFENGYVVFRDGKIQAVGPMEEIGSHLAEFCEKGWVIRDAERGIVMPGMVNTHCHMGMIPFRGLGDDCKDRLRVFLLPMAVSYTHLTLPTTSRV